MGTQGPERVSVVLDASAMVAFLRAEAGWEHVREVLPGAVLSTVNLGEVFRVTGVIAPDVVVTRLRALGVSIKPLSAQDAWLQAQVPNITEYGEDGGRKRRRLGWGDRTAAALGLRLGLPVLTSDPGLVALGPPFRFASFR
jgi:PIN domain nuclease of toxin-antitoxin system